MKLNEIMLYESFTDLKRILNQKFEEKFGSSTPDNAQYKQVIDNEEMRKITDLMIILAKIKKYDDGAPDKKSVLNASGMTQSIKYVLKKLKHSLSQDIRDTGFWIKNAKSEDWYMNTVSSLYDSYIEYLKYLGDPSREPADFETVADTDAYKITKLNNYSAARSVCNNKGIDWCIGSSNTKWFSDYGKQQGREHHIIELPNEELLAVQSGKNGFLITSQDNNYEFGSYQGDGRADANQISARIHESDLEPDEIRDMLSEIISPKYLDMAIESLAPIPVKLFDVSKDDNGNLKIVFDTFRGLKKTISAKPNSTYSDIKTIIGSDYRIIDPEQHVNSAIKNASI